MGFILTWKLIVCFCGDLKTYKRKSEIIREYEIIIRFFTIKKNIIRNVVKEIP